MSSDPPRSARSAADLLPGLALVAAIAVVASGLALLLDGASALTIGVLLGAVVANAWTPPTRLRPGIEFAARDLLRIGIVLLGFRLSLGDLAELGTRGLVVVVLVVACTFVGTRWIGARLGLSTNLSLLVATGYSICGASAVAAMDGVVEADEEEAAYAVAMVTLCGSLSILVVPVVGHLLGLSDVAFGSWSGAAVHDVAQVVATASTRNATALEAATVVKLTRVALLAPLVAAVALRRRTTHGATGSVRPPLLPLFVVGFLCAILVTSTGALSDRVLDGLRSAEKLVLTLALVALGLGVRVEHLRQLGGRPLVLGLVAWLLVATVALLGVVVASP